MNKNSFTVLSAFSLSLLLPTGCTGDTDECVRRNDQVSIPQIVTRTETLPTTGSFIGFDTNKDFTFCYHAQRNGTVWDWSDLTIPHPKTVDGKELAHLAVVMPKVDTRVRYTTLGQMEYGELCRESGLLVGVAECVDAEIPSSFLASQKLAKLHIINEEGVLDNISSITLHLAPEAHLDLVLGTMETSTDGTKTFDYAWSADTKSYSLAIFPQEFQDGATLMEYEVNGETKQVTFPTAYTVGPNQTLTVKFTNDPSSFSPISIGMNITPWTEIPENVVEGNADQDIPSTVPENNVTNDADASN